MAFRFDISRKRQATMWTLFVLGAYQLPVIKDFISGLMATDIFGVTTVNVAVGMLAIVLGWTIHQGHQ